MKAKYILTILAMALFGAVAVYAVAPTADSEDMSKDQASYIKADGQTYAVRVTSSGHIVGGTDRQIDLGSPNKRMRNIYASSVTVQTGNLGIGTDSFVNFGTPTSTAAAANVTIPYTGSYVIVTSTEGPIKMTATPNISTATARDGDWLTVISATTSVILQDRLSIANTGVALGAATRTLGYLDNISFRFYASSGVWVEQSFTNVQ